MNTPVPAHERTLVAAFDAVTRRTALKGLGGAGIAALVGSTQVSSLAAQDATPAAGAGLESYPEITVIAQDYAFEMPAELGGGLTQVTLRNDGHDDHHAIFIHLNEQVSEDELAAALAQPDIFQVLHLGDVLGGPNGAAMGGGTATVIMDLVPGPYVVVCVIPDAEGVPHYMLGMHALLTVSESDSALAPPASSQTVELVDFGFDHLPAEVPAGPQVWEVTNVGQEPHEFGLLMLAPGVTFDAVASMLGEAPAEGSASPEGDSMETHDMAASPAAGMAASPEAAMGPPFTFMPSTAPKNPGMTNWLVLDLMPGEYVAICFVPSPANGFAPHFALGMLMPFTVV
jgi:hypothetical protein